ncbi:hypothetical protein D3C71_1141530 [compost metagenome]
MTDGDLAGREIDEEGRYRERGEAASTALIDGTHRLRDRTEATDAGCDDCRCSQPVFIRGRFPICLRQCLFCRRQRKDDEPVDLALILWRNDPVRIEASFRVFADRRDNTSHFRRKISYDIVGQPPNSALAGKEPRP